ncbi:hypothetical protein [Nonomuraea insulae]|uniref:Uncharacterized protein n=1 Tax=Nonomuraea insulae TaxID=1616787 RepID=A0ABW1CN21_9ACTN
MIKGAKPAEEPPVFECQWGWNGSVGGFYPEAWLKYVATFECGEDYGVGPDMSGTIRGSLHDSPGGLIRHTGPDEAFTFCCGLDLSYVESGGEITLTGPGQKFYINNDSIIDLLPNPADNIVWIWSYLPAGCEGVGSPRAVCNLNSGEWAIN